MAQTQCSACGEERLVLGSIRSTGAVHFRPQTASFFVLRTAEIKVQAYMCDTCGAIALVGDTARLRSVRPTLARDQQEPKHKTVQNAKPSGGLGT